MADRGDLALRLYCSFAVLVPVNQHRSACLCQRNRNRPANPAGGAGDDSGPIGERLVHGE